MNEMTIFWAYLISYFLGAIVFGSISRQDKEEQKRVCSPHIEPPAKMSFWHLMYILSGFYAEQIGHGLFGSMLPPIGYFFWMLFLFFPVVGIMFVVVAVGYFGIAKPVVYLRKLFTGDKS